MQFLISVIDDRIIPGPPSDMPAIGRFNDRLRAEGHWVYANGLSDPSAATVIDGRGKEPLITDGPFAETKEYLAGFWVIEAPDLDVAMRIAAEGSKVCNRKVELRPFRVLGK
jgi:hypothetical protein